VVLCLFRKILHSMILLYFCYIYLAFLHPFIWPRGFALQSGGVGALQDGSLLSSAVVLDPQSFGAMATGGGVVVRRIQGGGANGSAGFVTADGRPLDNRMRLSRSLRALDLDGLEENLTQRNISAHWDLDNSRWQAEKED